MPITEFQKWGGHGGQHAPEEAQLQLDLRASGWVPPKKVKKESRIMVAGLKPKPPPRAETAPFGEKKKSTKKKKKKKAWKLPEGPPPPPSRPTTSYLEFSRLKPHARHMFDPLFDQDLNHETLYENRTRSQIYLENTPTPFFAVAGTTGGIQLTGAGVKFKNITDYQNLAGGGARAGTAPSSSSTSQSTLPAIR